MTEETRASLREQFRAALIRFCLAASRQFCWQCFAVISQSCDGALLSSQFLWGDLQ